MKQPFKVVLEPASYAAPERSADFDTREEALQFADEMGYGEVQEFVPDDGLTDGYWRKVQFHERD